MTDDALRGVSVLVAGAGLAGLVAARELSRHGANLLIVEAADRVGGRVWTLRDRFADGQHAEAGGDLIDEGQSEIRRLAEELGLKMSRVLRGGFSAIRHSAPSRRPDITEGWRSLERGLEREIRAYALAERRWDSAVAGALARQSVADWLDRVGATEGMRSTALAMRGFFLADPSELSLLALVDQFAEEETPGQGRMYRIDGGNDAIASALAALFGGRIRVRTALLSIRHSPDAIDATVQDRAGRLDQLHADYIVCTMPATTLRHVNIDPPLPSAQHDAIERLKYGPATKTALQFDRPAWRGLGKPRAFGTDLPIGAVWDANEEQAGRAGLITLLAGGSASMATRRILSEGGIEGIVKYLDWLDLGEARLIAHEVVSWEDNPWAQGGYAYFDTGYDPAWREWLARPCGRVLFAGEHTSMRWQGYMNGAVESGLRAAAEIYLMARG